MDFLNCGNKDLTPEQLVAALLTKDADGNVAIRTMFVDACEEDAINCVNGSLPLNVNLSKAIGISDCGKPALRLGMTVEALATYMGIAFASPEAAQIAIGPSALFYNTTTNAWDTASVE